MVCIEVVLVSLVGSLGEGESSNERENDSERCQATSNVFLDSWFEIFSCLNIKGVSLRLATSQLNIAFKRFLNIISSHNFNFSKKNLE